MNILGLLHYSEKCQIIDGGYNRFLICIYCPTCFDPSVLEKKDSLTLIKVSKTKLPNEVMPNWSKERRWGVGIDIVQFSNTELKNSKFTPFTDRGKRYVDLDADGLMDLARLIQSQLD